jgi:aquaporin Z
VLAAFAAEVAITFVLMSAVLLLSNTAALARVTGLAAGALVAVYISVEAPVSGMSMNPARSFASAVPAGVWTSFWIYVAAPPLGMLLAAEAWRRSPGTRVLCAKIHHGPGRCIFRCRYHELEAPREALAQDQSRAVQA